MSYNLFPKFHVRYEGFSFYDPIKSDEGADKDLVFMKKTERNLSK